MTLFSGKNIFYLHVHFAKHLVSSVAFGNKSLVRAYAK